MLNTNNEMKKVNTLETGAILKEQRIQHKYERADIAKKLGVSVQAIYKWEHGQCLPTVENLINLADIYDTTLIDLISIA